MEKLYFDESTFIWKTKLNRISEKFQLLKEANHVIES